MSRQVLKGHFSLLPKTASMAMHFKDWDGKQPGDAEIDMEVLMESEELAQFYGIRFKGKNAERRREGCRHYCNQ